jgi:hypothetical protein
LHHQQKMQDGCACRCQAVLRLSHLLQLLLLMPAAMQAWLNSSSGVLVGSACLFQMAHPAVQQAFHHSFNSSFSSSSSSSSSQREAILSGKRYQASAVNRQRYQNQQQQQQQQKLRQVMCGSSCLAYSLR